MSQGAFSEVLVHLRRPEGRASSISKHRKGFRNMCPKGPEGRHYTHAKVRRTRAFVSVVQCSEKGPEGRALACVQRYFTRYTHMRGRVGRAFALYTRKCPSFGHRAFLCIAMLYPVIHIRGRDKRDFAGLVQRYNSPERRSCCCFSFPETLYTLYQNA